jgi:succinate-semialdehyde dehydrogenase/glutarate-semialdehyde dehydrogenase
MDSVNPTTGERIRHYDEHDIAAADAALSRARETFLAWRDRPIADRAARVRAAAGVLRGAVAEFARLMTLEMGKPIAAAEAEVEKCAWACDHFAEHGPRYLADEPIASDASRSYTRCEPLGAVLAVMPWNFPFWQAIRCAAPALVAGNVIVLKHASNVPGSALALERVFREAGLPEGAFTTLLVPSSRVAAIIGDPRIAAVSVTGS